MVTSGFYANSHHPFNLIILQLNLWQYGDFTEDDAREFGLGK
jgi:hypothetical protein